MQFYTIITIIISISAVFAYINFRFIKLPVTIGIMVLSLAFSVLLVTIGHYTPSISNNLISIIHSIDFHELLMNMMLSFLLFAGAIHINLADLKKELAPVIILASIGILISTFIIGAIVYYLFIAFNNPIDFLYCLLFGALISPTDPIAVLGILKKAGIAKSMELKISGESLFNDGMAVVVFLAIYQLASPSAGAVSTGDIVELFLIETGGGLLYGLLLGYVGFWLLRSIDSYQVEVLITIAIVMGGYSLAHTLHVSGPLAMVVAGIITGNKGKALAMSDVTRDYLGKFWELIDDILNTILFLLIGFEVLVIKVNATILLIGGIVIVVVLFARWVSVAFPIMLLKLRMKFEKNAIAILTWGGLRGGISVALALSLPSEMYRNEFVTITYIVVIFSIIVQGLTIGKVSKKLMN
ncbi:MAG: sodium:proton antiporter [Flavipsychrobacter sp.]